MMFDLRVVRDAILTYCREYCEGYLVIECGVEPKAYLKIDGYEYGSPPPQNIFKKYVFRSIKDNVSCGEGEPKYIVYSFKRDSESYQVSTYISIKPYLRVFSRGILGYTLYKSILNSVYVGGGEYIPIIRLSYKVLDLIRSFKPIIFKGHPESIKDLDLEYSDLESILDKIFTRFFRESQGDIKPIFHKLYSLNYIRPGIRYGRYSEGLFIDINDFSPPQDLYSLIGMPSLYILRASSSINIPPPYIEIDLSKLSSILYFGEPFGGV